MSRKQIKTELLIHDLKNPLAVVRAGIEGLISRRDFYGSLTEKQEKVLFRMLRNIRAAGLMVNDTLELARAEEGIVHKSNVVFGKMITLLLAELFDLMDTGISDCIRNCGKAEKVKKITASGRLFLQFETKIWEQSFFLDEAKTVQILRNLLGNAFKHKKKRVDFSAGMEKNHIIFSVKDDGPGIPGHYQKKIFESYYQIIPKEYGTVRGHGIGLAGVMTLLRELDGELTLNSESGKGAEFIVKIKI